MFYGWNYRYSGSRSYKYWNIFKDKDGNYYYQRAEADRPTDKKWIATIKGKNAISSVIRRDFFENPKLFKELCEKAEMVANEKDTNILEENTKHPQPEVDIFYDSGNYYLIKNGDGQESLFDLGNDTSDIHTYLERGHLMTCHNHAFFMFPWKKGKDGKWKIDVKTMKGHFYYNYTGYREDYSYEESNPRDISPYLLSSSYSKELVKFEIPKRWTK